MPNVDKNNKINPPPKYKEPKIPFYSKHEKRSKLTNSSTELIVEENQFVAAIVIADIDHHILITFADDLHIDEIHKPIHKTDIANQTARITNIGIISQYPTQTEVTISTIIEIDCSQLIKTDITQLIDQETLQISIKNKKKTL